MRTHVLQGVPHKVDEREAGMSGLPQHLPEVAGGLLSSARDMKENITISNIVRKVRGKNAPQEKTPEERKRSLVDEA